MKAYKIFILVIPVKNCIVGMFLTCPILEQKTAQNDN